MPEGGWPIEPESRQEAPPFRPTAEQIEAHLTRFDPKPFAPAMGRFERSFRLLRISIQVPKEHPGLFAIPIGSGIVQLAIVGVVAYIAKLDGVIGGVETHSVDPVVWMAGGIGILAITYTAVIARSMIIVRTMAILKGDDQSNTRAFGECMRHSHQLFGWAFLNMTLGVLLMVISEELGFVGRIISWLVSITWSLITLFAIPVIVFEDIGPIKAVRRSSSIFRESWGEEIIGTGVIGMTFMLAYLVVLIIAGVAGAVIVPAGVLIGVVGMVVILALSAVVSGVFNTALFHYSTTGETGLGFDSEDLESAFRPKRRTWSSGRR